MQLHCCCGIKANALLFLLPSSNGKCWIMRMHVLLLWHLIGLIAAKKRRRLMQMRCCCCMSANALLLTFPRIHGVAEDVVVALWTEAVLLWPMPN